MKKKNESLSQFWNDVKRGIKKWEKKGGKKIPPKTRLTVLKNSVSH